MEWSECLIKLRSYLENRPLIVLGSGASIPYGLPSMAGLAEKIKKSTKVMSDNNFSDFCRAIDSLGLEEAMDSVSLNSETKNEIRMIVWKSVNKKDMYFFDNKLNLTLPPNPLESLFKKVIEPTPNHVVIVTTNYDRLAEYAADKIGATTVTGLEGNLIKKLEDASTTISRKRIRTRERVVEIWKVHGSLDWFCADDGNIISFPLSRFIPKGMNPLIIPPGKGKYSSTHSEPYRTIISKADKAFIDASSYLCIGYGFNDDHIQPKLLEEITKGKPIVILAKKMTPACKRHIIDAEVSKYLIFEEADSEHTKVYGNGWKQTYAGRFWLLDEFMKIW